MPGEVNLTVSLNKSQFPVTGARQLAYVLIEATPSQAMATVQMPLNLSLALDKSGSMAGQKIADLKTAAKMAIDNLSPDDFISLIVFDDTASVVFDSQKAADKKTLKAAVDRIRDGGGTHISFGMSKGLTELEKQLGSDRASRMILLTDGETFGDENNCRVLAKKAGDAGIPISAFGLGEDWVEELLDDIADASGGASDYIDTPDKISAAFSRTVRTVQAAVVQNANLIMRLTGGVTPRNIWRVTPLITRLGAQHLSDRDVQTGLGELTKGQGQSALVELLFPARNVGRYRMAQVEISYDVPSEGAIGEKVKQDLIVDFTNDPAAAKQSDPRVMNIVEKVTAHKLQTRALDAAAMGDITSASKQLRAAATRLLELGETDLADTAHKEADRLEKEGKMSSGGTKKLRYETRKLTMNIVDDILVEED
ncbi:MAG: VWA domain-containing protein [Anaerolineales bacterium]|nr:VWA domain-containing protein [Anaerolineales bacterium]